MYLQEQLGSSCYVLRCQYFSAPILLSLQATKASYSSTFDFELLYTYLIDAALKTVEVLPPTDLQPTSTSCYVA